MKWILTSEETPKIGSNVVTSDDGINIGETMDYLENRRCMLAGIGGGNGYFGEGFATDGSTECERGLILDEPKYWQYSDVYEMDLILIASPQFCEKCSPDTWANVINSVEFSKQECSNCGHIQGVSK